MFAIEGDKAMEDETPLLLQETVPCSGITLLP
jgi:hypothetical protein